MIQFEHPQAFFFLALVPLLFVLRRLGVFSKISFPLTISDWQGKSFIYTDSLSKIGSFFSHLCAISAFMLLVVALANPIIRNREKIYTSRGTDILFVLDTSPSMAARDISLATLKRQNSESKRSLLLKTARITAWWQWQAKRRALFRPRATSNFF